MSAAAPGKGGKGKGKGRGPGGKRKGTGKGKGAGSSKIEGRGDAAVPTAAAKKACADLWLYCANEAANKCPPATEAEWNDEHRWWAHHCRATCRLCALSRTGKRTRRERGMWAGLDGQPRRAGVF